MTSLPININNQNNSLLSTYELLKYRRFDACRKSKKYVPNLNPFINSLSNYSTKFNTYIKIYIYGDKFLPNGLTSVDFGNIQNIIPQYINPNTLYLELYNFAFPGVYNIVVKNNFYFSARNTTAASVNVTPFESNVVQYTIIQ
jgi:hypothetical protein